MFKIVLDKNKTFLSKGVLPGLIVKKLRYVIIQSISPMNALLKLWLKFPGLILFGFNYELGRKTFRKNFAITTGHNSLCLDKTLGML